jgi:cell division protein FtsZ
MPSPAETIAAVIAIGLAVLLLLRIALAVPGWVRRARKPESRVIRVVGVGGGGSNAVDRMVRARIPGVGFVAFNTDAQALRRSTADSRIRIGRSSTRGLGSGGDPETGRSAADEDADRIRRAVAGADLVFVTAGLGGGTGSGAGPVVAASAKDQGALTIGVATTPFAFEGSQRARIAAAAAVELGANVNALIVVPNERVAGALADDASVAEAFRVVDEVLLQAVRGVIELITAPGIINLDFADIRSVMQDAGAALIGIGRGAGENRATDAARAASAGTMLESGIAGARAIVLNVAGPSDLQLREVRQAAEVIREQADPDANIIFGTSLREALGDEVQVTVIAAGLAGHRARELTDDGPAGGPGRTPGAKAQRRRGSPGAQAGPPQASGPTTVVPEHATASDWEALERPAFERRGRVDLPAHDRGPS